MSEAVEACNFVFAIPSNREDGLETGAVTVEPVTATKQ